MNRWILTILALTLAACGGGGGESAQPSPPVTTLSNPTGSSTGLRASSGPNTDDFCTIWISGYWCDDGDRQDVSNASAVHSQISDTEPNDDIANAVAVHWPGNTSAGQRIGFGVDGSINASGDVADFFAFTPPRSADYMIGLCRDGKLCGPFSPDDTLPVTSATLRILDQFGVEIFSEELYPGSANYFETRFESGTLYYAVVVAEDIAGAERSYRLMVGELLQQPAEEEPASVPAAPQLSAFVVDSFTNVQLDWTPPSYNEDGTQLTDLAGFNVYIYDYVRDGDSDERRLVETINDPSLTTRTIRLEGYSDWYVSITAFNEAGIESAHSNGVELVNPPE